MKQISRFLKRLGWETHLGAGILVLLFAGGIFLPYISPSGGVENREDSYCTPSLTGQSVKSEPAGEAQSPSAQEQESDLFGAQSPPSHAQGKAEMCSRNYLFGTDVGGRDIFYYIITTSTKYLFPSMIVMTASILLGSFFGIMAGYYGEYIAGQSFSMLSNAISVYPPLLFVLLLTRILNNPSIAVIAAAFALTESARLGFMVMNKIQVLREEEFISAAKEMGLSDWRIITKHLLWYNCREVLLVHGIFSISGFVMIELYLGYLNAGNFGAWGAIIGPGARNFDEHWWLLLLPCLVVIVTIFAFYLLGDGLVKYFGTQMSGAEEEEQ